MPDLAPGQAVDPALRLQHALDVAYRYLGRRERTVVEMRRHLEQKGEDPGAIDGAVAELGRTGYLDDAGYAQRFAEDRRSLDAWGPDRIERRLQQLGVESEHVQRALGARDAAAELDAAVALLARRFREPPASDRDRQKALGQLVRRGYGLELSHEAIRLYARSAAA